MLLASSRFTRILGSVNFSSRNVSFVVKSSIYDKKDPFTNDCSVAKFTFEMTPTVLGVHKNVLKFSYQIPRWKEYLNKIDINGEFYTFSRARFLTNKKSTVHYPSSTFETQQLVDLNHDFGHDDTYIYVKCRNGLSPDYFRSIYEVIIPEWSDIPVKIYSSMTDSMGNRLVESEIIHYY